MEFFKTFIFKLPQINEGCFDYQFKEVTRWLPVKVKRTIKLIGCVVFAKKYGKNTLIKNLLQTINLDKKYYQKYLKVAKNEQTWLKITIKGNI